MLCFCKNDCAGKMHYLRAHFTHPKLLQTYACACVCADACMDLMALRKRFNEFVLLRVAEHTHTHTHTHTTGNDRESCERERKRGRTITDSFLA
jgi:hypothetical protein